MIGKKIEEELETKLSVSKKLSTDLSFNLQQLSEKVMTCVQDTDTTEEEILKYGNPEILEAVKLLTKEKSYLIHRILLICLRTNVN